MAALSLEIRLLNGGFAQQPSWLTDSGKQMVVFSYAFFSMCFLWADYLQHTSMPS